MTALLKLENFCVSYRTVEALHSDSEYCHREHNVPFRIVWLSEDDARALYDALQFMPHAEAMRRAEATAGTIDPALLFPYVAPEG